jgi:hypothetical protein
MPRAQCARQAFVAPMPVDIFQPKRLPSVQRSMHMSTTKIIGILLIAAGVLGLIYGGFSYTKETHTAKLGPLELKVQEKETVIVPVIVSAGAIALGVFLIVAGRNK